MLKKILFWLKCSRAYTLPVTFFSWVVIFCYAIKHNGNVIYGLLALLGILLCHLATNLFDDYIDFKTLKRVEIDGKTVLPNTQKGKCEYLLNNSVTTKDVLKTVIIYLTLAGFIGIFFIWARGLTTLLFMAFAGIIILTYSYLSNLRLSEFAVALAYGPLLFGGPYFVMTGDLSINSFLLSIPSTIFTLNLIYTDTLMDYDIDKAEGKKTFVGMFDKQTAKYIQIGLLILGYLSAFKINPFTLLTTPLAVELLLSNENFITKMFQARNLMVYNSCLLAIAIIL